MSASPPFVLLPWEFEGSPHSPLADATCTARWQGKSVSMRLKVHENLLFFAPSGNNRQLFALSQPLAKTAEEGARWKERPHELPLMFERAVENREWGRLVTFPRTVAFNKQKRCDIALLDGRGGGWVRSLYSDYFEPIEPDNFVSEAPQLVHGSVKELRRVLRKQWELALIENEKQAISPAACRRAYIAPTWVSGSLAGLRSALEAALVLFPPQIERGYRPHPSVYTRSVLQKERLDWRSFHPLPELEKMANLLLRVHVCVGQTLRSDGSFFEPFFVISPREVSMHDRMEALLALRDMARDTPIEAETAQFLATVRL